MDAAEFKAKVIPLSGKLFHFARLLLKDHAEAEDSVQEIFLKLWKMRNELAEYTNLEAFAMREIFPERAYQGLTSDIVDPT